MVYVPAFKYRIGDLPEGDLPTQKWGVNSVQVWKADDPECPENAVLHRAFIDGGEQKAGFFCDKYLCSPANDGSCAVSIKNKAPISLTSNSLYGPLLHLLMAVQLELIVQLLLVDYVVMVFNV